MSRNTIERSLFKTITYRIVGTIATTVIGFFVTRDIISGIKIGTVDIVVKMAIYFLHERVWQTIDFGKKIS